jgi:hypothetical protein
MHLVNQNESRKPLSMSSHLSLNRDDIITVKSTDIADEINLQVSKIGKTKPTGYSTPNIGNENQASKSYKEVANESLVSSQIISKSKRLNEVDTELINAKKHSKRDIMCNLEPKDLDLDLLCHNKVLVETTTTSTKTRTTTKIKKVIYKFVTNNFKSAKR